MKGEALPSVRKAVVIKEVAVRARVSPATVSRVMNGTAKVAAALKERVGKAIEELGYLPNPQARALVSGRSRTLGLLISEITNPFFPELIQSFQHLAEAHGFEVMFGSTNYNLDTAKLLVKRMLQRRVEGVAVMTFRAEEALLHDLIAHNVPLVSIDVSTGGTRAATLTINYEQGIHQAVQHLAALGHRRLAFISGPMQHLTNIRRRDAFCTSLAKIGLKPQKNWLVEGDHTLEGGMRAAEQLLAGTLPTAVLCSNDMTAFGVIRCLHRHSIRVPGQMSVVGFDDIHLAEFVSPPVTTVRMSREELAGAAFHALQKLMHGVPVPPGHASLAIASTLVVRESTDVPPNPPRTSARQPPRGRRSPPPRT